MPRKRTKHSKRAPLQDIVPNSSSFPPATEDDHNDSESLSVEETSQDDCENFSIVPQKSGTKSECPGKTHTQSPRIARVKVVPAKTTRKKFARAGHTPAIKKAIYQDADTRKAKAKLAAIKIQFKWECKVGQPSNSRKSKAKASKKDKKQASSAGDSIHQCARIRIEGKTKSEFYEFSPFSQGYLVDTQPRFLDTVELENGAFIRVRQDTLGPYLVGHLFERNTRLMGWLPKTEDEVFWLWTFPSGHPENAQPAIVKAPVSAVRQVWNLCLTPPRNTRYSFPRDRQSSLEAAQYKYPISEIGTLTCSWKYVRASDATINRAEYQPKYASRFEESSLIAVPGMEDDGDGSRHAEKALGGYTFGDAFAGCGGMSRAALTAGFEIQWGFDMDPAAAAAYMMNFPNTRMWDEWATEFIKFRTDTELNVDVLHLSPPCQYFSSAHTVPGQNDQLNIASLFIIPAILQKTNPRVATVEEVPSIMSLKHDSYFCNLIQFFTFSGYSIRWKVMRCVDFGVPQLNRCRLFVIGSRPGTDLPNFPSRTHADPRSPSRGWLPRWRTVADAIGNIPSNCSEHTPVNFSFGEKREKYDANSPHHLSVTTKNGTQFHHPNGKRLLTQREIACLQTFPTSHEFSGTGSDIGCQIGNAVPPLMGQVILEEVRRSLMRTDAIDNPAPQNTELQFYQDPLSSMIARWTSKWDWPWYRERYP